MIVEVMDFRREFINVNFFKYVLFLIVCYIFIYIFKGNNSFYFVLKIIREIYVS